MNHVDASEIASGLWVGSIPPTGPDLQNAGFDALVLCAKEHQPSSQNFPGLTVVHAPFADAELSRADAGVALEAARRVAARMSNEELVLVTCIEGRNRSALVAALALHLVCGLSGSECGRLVRQRRALSHGHALTNPAFVKLLLHL